MLRALILAAGMMMAAAQAFASERFTVEVRGHGPDVILIPGLASSAAVWDGTVKQLEGRYRLHVISISGFAGAPARANASGELIAPLADDLSADARTLNKPAVIGHSLGGLLGLMMTERHGGDLSKVLVVDALPFYGALVNPFATADMLKPQAAMMRDAIIAQPAPAFAQMQSGGVARLVKTEAYRPTILDWSLKSDRGVFARAFYEDTITDVRPGLAAIATPITVIYAYDQIMGPQAMTDQLYAGQYSTLKNGKLIRIDGAYHFVMLDQPDAFAKAVEEFLR